MDMGTVNGQWCRAGIAMFKVSIRSQGMGSIRGQEVGQWGQVRSRQGIAMCDLRGVQWGMGRLSDGVG